MTMRHRACSLGTALCILTAGTSGQDLKGDWERIQAEFLGGLHDSVVVHIRPFILEMEKRDLKAQLSVAYFHYAVSLAQLGKEFQADSCFELSKGVARSAALPEKAKEIEQKQIQLYLSLAKQSEKKDLRRAAEHYGKAIGRLAAGEDMGTLLSTYYQRGALFRSLNESGRAIKDFEAAMDLISRPGADQNLRSSLVSLLTELYLNTGNTEKAARLAGGANRSRIEYTIKLAAEAEGRGEFGKSDEHLRSIQQELVMTKDDARIVEFLKKRYSLYERQGRSDAAFDTLRSLLAVLERVISPIVRFQGEQLLVLLHVQKGQIKEAVKRVEGMRRLVSGGMLPAEFGGQIERTQGDIAYLQGDNQKAIQHYRRALSEPTAFEEPEKLSLFNNLGLALARDGQEEEALRLFQQMHSQAKGLKLPAFESQADLNGGLVLIKLDRIREATGQFQRARETAVRANDPTLQIMASMRLAESFRRSGFEKLASDMFEEVRKDLAGLTNPLSRIQVLQALALNAKIAGNKYTALLRLKEAYDLAGRVGATGFLGTLAIDLGDTYFFVDSLDHAKTMYREALRYYEGSGDLRAIVEQQYKLGQCYLTGGEYEPARREILKGLALLIDGTVKDFASVDPASVKDIDLFGQGLANAGFVDFTEGRERKDVGRLLYALQLVQKSVDVLEARKGSILTGAQSESEGVKNVNAYRLLVDVASALFGATRDERYFGLAFDMSEKSRAASFVSEVGSQLITKLHDPKVKELAETTSKLIEEGKNRPEALTLDLTSPGQGTRGIGTKADRSRDADEKTRSQYEKIVTRLSAENNKAAQLVTVNTLTLSSVRSLLREDEVLINYYVSIDKLYALGVSTSGVIMKTIQWTPEDVSGKVEAYRSAVHDLQRNDYAVLGQELYDSLIAPLGPFIAGKKLIAIPSGRLNNLPFAGLQNEGEFLAERYEISIVPNASTLQFVRKEKKLPGAPSVFALGNPDNPRVSRLPGAEKEVGQVKSIYPRSLIHFGRQATETIAKEQMGGFDIIHIACHGLFNYDYPYLSSLVLTPDSYNDGFLEVHELYNLNLTNANLVILSACETGLSQIKKNDDVIGLVRGFLYSGVPSMVASLWKVDDQATAALMSNLHLLLKLGNSKSDALRKAQLQLLRTPATRHPFFWAAFVLYGSAL